MKKTAVVILNYNGADWLAKFLPEVILHSSQEADIVVIDNKSTDHSLTLLKEQFPRVQLILLEENYGFTGGYNKGLQQLQHPYFVLLNSDVQVSKNWISPIIDAFEKNESLVIAQPKILSWKEKNKFEYAGAAGGYMDYLGYPFCRGRILQSIEKDHGQYDQPTEVFWASGACMFVKSKIYNDLKGLDESFFAHMEEIDLCWRAQRLGYTVMVIPTSVVYHVGGGTLSYDSPVKVYLNFRNNLMMLAKNLKGWRLALLIPRFILDGQAAIVMLLSGNHQAFLSVIKAHFYFYGHWRPIFKKRRALNQLIRKQNKTDQLPKTIYKKSILLQYFLFGKKAYLQLSKK